MKFESLDQIKDEIGNRYGRLIVVAKVGITRSHKCAWLCQCDCGQTHVARGLDLRQGKVKSCGCLRREGRVRHGHARAHLLTGAYRSWQAMLRRCDWSKHRYFHNYGGRGIRVCERWLVFENFLADMGQRPKGMTLDRIDNDRDYESRNCRWATRKQQRKNQRHE